MIRRTRTAKKLAQRIDLSYLKRKSPLKRAQFLLSIAVPLLGLAWVGGMYGAKDNRIYSSGALSRSHVVFNTHCEVCHNARPWTYRRHANDASCSSCHDGPLHQVNQTFTPDCGYCHREHEGRMANLSTISDRGCTVCHANLKGTTPVKFVTNISSFTGNHPDFAALKGKDPGTVKLNHKLHMKLKNATCSWCHTPAPAQSTGQAGALEEAVDTRPGSTIRDAAGAYMEPISYPKHCQRCHALKFGDQTLIQTVPHDKPEVIDAFLKNYIASHPASAKDVQQAEQDLWDGTCTTCHQETEPETGLPTVAKSDIPTRWMPHAFFSHEPHKLVACTDCHSQAPTSTKTEDIMLPSVKTCQSCHKPQAAESSCFECHSYHDWRKAKPTHTDFKIPQLVQLDVPGIREKLAAAVR